MTKQKRKTAARKARQARRALEAEAVRLGVKRWPARPLKAQAARDMSDAALREAVRKGRARGGYYVVPKDAPLFWSKRAKERFALLGLDPRGLSTAPEV